MSLAHNCLLITLIRIRVYTELIEATDITVASFNTQHLDSEIFNEFIEEFDEHHKLVKDAISQLNANPEDYEKINQLVRSSHTVKGDLAMQGMSDLSAIFKGCEMVLREVDDRTFAYSIDLGKMLLVIFMYAKAFLKRCQIQSQIQYNEKLWATISLELNQVKRVRDLQRPQHINRVITLLTKKPTKPSEKTMTESQSLPIVREKKLSWWKAFLERFKK